MYREWAEIRVLKFVKTCVRQKNNIVPHLRQIVDGQNRTYKNIDVRRIKIEQWHEYLILKKFRSRRR